MGQKLSFALQKWSAWAKSSGSAPASGSLFKRPCRLRPDAFFAAAPCPPAETRTGPDARDRRCAEELCLSPSGPQPALSELAFLTGLPGCSSRSDRRLFGPCRLFSRWKNKNAASAAAFRLSENVLSGALSVHAGRSHPGGKGETSIAGTSRTSLPDSALPLRLKVPATLSSPSTDAAEGERHRGRFLKESLLKGCAESREKLFRAPRGAPAPQTPLWQPRRNTPDPVSGQGLLTERLNDEGLTTYIVSPSEIWLPETDLNRQPSD